MIGSDVVDLRDAESRPESFRPRFDERVFSREERRAIAEDADPLARRWAHWGAKEAAYKLVKQIDPAFVFAPGRWAAHFAPISGGEQPAPVRERRGWIELSASKQAEPWRIDLRSFETSDRVHVVAIPIDSDWDAVDMGVAVCQPQSEDPSVAVRELAAHAIGRRLGVARTRVTIGKRGRVPIALLDGEPAALSLSLSHHGAWIGFATRPGVDAVGDGVSLAESIDVARRAAGAGGSR
jgi:hypothetical protein